MGLKRTVIVALCPEPRLYELLPTMLNPDAVVEADPESVPVPMFMTVKVRVLVWPIVTSPKACEEGVTEITGVGVGGGGCTGG